MINVTKVLFLFAETDRCFESKTDPTVTSMSLVYHLLLCQRLLSVTHSLFCLRYSRRLNLDLMTSSGTAPPPSAQICVQDVNAK